MVPDRHGSGMRPVTKLDAYQLGSGKIGPVTARILARFQELTQTTGTAF